VTGSLLVFTRTIGYRHDSIPAGIATLGELGFAVEATEDPAAFTTDLSHLAAVVFLSTMGEVLDEDQQAGLRRVLTGGAGFAGIHSAAATHPDWPYFGGLVAARFVGHPPLQPGRILVEDGHHPATAHLTSEWRWTDEWYDFTANPRSGVRVLLRVDESSYGGGSMGADHPVAWTHEYDGVRCFYTSLGHPVEAYAEPAFRAHLAGGIRSVLRR
jgi:type 1 glutamine amidotransferase